MRTTLNIEDELTDNAAKLTGITEKHLLSGSASKRLSQGKAPKGWLCWADPKINLRRYRAGEPEEHEMVPVNTSSSESKLYEHPSELLQNLIRFDTTNPPGNEAACIRYINDLLTEAGFETAIFAKDPDRPNLITRLKGNGNAPPLLLYGHVDVVTTAFQEWAHPPFEAEEADGFIWGRGALDMKGGMAMMLSALIRAKAEKLIPGGDPVLAVLSDEKAVGDIGGYPLYMGNKKSTPSRSRKSRHAG